MLDARLPRFWKLGLLTVLAVGYTLYHVLAPEDRVLLYVAKLTLITGGAVLGYVVDRAAFPYARPHELAPDQTAFSVATIRRAIIVAAAMLAAAFGA